MISKLAICGAIVLAVLAGQTAAKNKAVSRPFKQGGHKAQVLAKYDTDKDGKLSAEEKAARQADLKAKREAAKAQRAAKRAELLAKYDTDKDGKLSAEERAAMKADLKSQPGAGKALRGGNGGGRGGYGGGKGIGAGGRRAQILEKYDTDKDGKLSAEEKAAMKADLKSQRGQGKALRGGKGGGRGGFGGGKGGHRGQTQTAPTA